MSKDRLLKEATIRRFQRLAAIPSINEAGAKMYDREEEVPVEDELAPEAEEVVTDVDDLADVVDEPVADAEELPAEDAEVGDLTLSPEQAEVLVDLGQQVAAAMGEEEAAEEVAALEEPAGEELELEPAADEFDLPSEGEEEELAEAMARLEESNIELVEDNSNAIINEVAKRVAKRLLQLKESRKKEALVNEIARRVKKKLQK